MSQIDLSLSLKFAFVSGAGMFMSVARVDMAGYPLPISQKANAILNQHRMVHDPGFF